MSTKNELYKEGIKLKGDKKYEEALAKFQASAQMDESFTVPLHAAVQCLTELDRHEEAIAMAKQLVEKEPNDHFAYIALSRACQRAGRVPEAEQAMMMGQQAQYRAAQSAKQ